MLILRNTWKFRSLIASLALALAAAASPVGVVAQEKAAPAADAQETFSAEPDAPAASDVIPDPAFDKFVDVSAIHDAIIERDSAALTDGALALSEAERILKRPRAGASAAQVIDVAIQVASQAGDKTSLERLARHAKSVGDAKLEERIDTMLQLASAPRAAVPMLKLNKPTEQELEVASMVNSDLTKASRTGDQGAIANIADYVRENRAAQTISADAEAAILKHLDQTKAAIVPADHKQETKDIDSLLDALADGSRGYQPGQVAIVIPSASAPPKGSNGLYNCSGQSVRLSWATGRWAFTQSALATAAKNAAKSTGGGTFPWDDKWYTRRMTDYSVIFLMVAHNTKTGDVRWSAIKNGDKWRVMRDTGPVQILNTNDQFKHTVKMNGWRLDFDVVNPPNTGSITGNDIKYGFGY